MYCMLAVTIATTWFICLMCVDVWWWSTYVCDGVDHKQTLIKVGTHVSVSQFIGVGDRQP